MKRQSGITVLVLAACALAVLAADRSPVLPSRDPAVVVPLLESFTRGKTYKDVVAILGKADLDVGSASPSATFRLSDGSSIHVITRGINGWPVREITMRQTNADEAKVLFRSNDRPRSHDKA